MEYIISDIHGCSVTLHDLLCQLKLTSDDKVYFLGDYIDRGPDSKGVLDTIMGMDNAICLMGNHEHMMLNASESFYDEPIWFSNGGKETLKSFGGYPSDKYMEFIKSMPLAIELDNFFLAHANIGQAKLETPKDILLWERYMVTPANWLNGKKYIVGHTPQPLDWIEDSMTSQKIQIDGGCVFREYPKYGNLVALRLDDMQLIVQKNIGE